MSNEHSYDRLCDYYRAKQKEKEIDMHKCNMILNHVVNYPNMVKTYICDFCGKKEEYNMTHSKARHDIGTRKEVIRFALFPMIIESRFVWLRRYKAVRVYKQFAYWEEWDNEYVFYCKWETVERKILRR